LSHAGWKGGRRFEKKRESTSCGGKKVFGTESGRIVRRKNLSGRKGACGRPRRKNGPATAEKEKGKTKKAYLLHRIEA